jgi:hypothetical protein
MRTSRDQGALDAPILSQGTNHARRASRQLATSGSAMCRTAIGAFRWASRHTSYRLDTKNGGEKHVTVSERKTKNQGLRAGKGRSAPPANLAEPIRLAPVAITRRRFRRCTF